MRLVAILLLIANGAFAGWQFFRVPPEPVVTPLRDPNIPSLELLAELDSPPPTLASQVEAPEPPAPTDQAPEEEVSEPSEPEWSCFTVGPFLEPEKAADLAQKIRDLGLPASERPLEQREVSSYWVYLPPSDSKAEALATARRLAQKGVKDYYVVTSGEARNAVSLGLFSEQSRAERRARAMQALGFSPEVEVRYRTKTLIWVDYDEMKGTPLSDDLWTVDGDAVQRLARSCAVAIQSGEAR